MNTTRDTIITGARKYASILCGAFLCFISVRAFYLMFFKDGIAFGRLIFLTLASIFSVGLLLQAPFARRLLSAMLLLVAIILPSGLLNPFMASDMIASGQRPPEVHNALLTIIPIELVLLALIWLVDPIIKKLPNQSNGKQ